MPYRDKTRRPFSTNSDLAPFHSFESAEFHFVETTTPSLTRRTVKITDRREVKVSEQEAGSESMLFWIPAKPAETATMWSSEQTIEVEEHFE